MEAQDWYNIVEAQDWYNIGSAFVIAITHYAAYLGTPKAILASKALSAVWKRVAGNCNKAENLRD